MRPAAPSSTLASASVQDWIAVLAGALGALLASLDVSIVNSALPQIQGEIGANGTEGTWIATGYLVSEVVMIPLTAWLAKGIGMRKLLLGCAVLFALFSQICGLSHDLGSMILGRVGQGFFGGALIPTAQTLIRTRLPPRQAPLGMALFSVIVLLGPLAGPVLGGWLTESASWRCCFFLNLPVAGGLIALLILGLPPDKHRTASLAGADWLGIIGMTAGLSCLTVLLEEGQRERWFESDLIRWLSLVSVAGFAALLAAQHTAIHPVLKLKLMLDRSYAAVIFIVLAVGAVLYGTVYVVPQFLSLISGYSARQSGMVLLLSGVPAFLMLPVMPLLLKADLRITVFFGLGMLTASCFLDTHLSAGSAGRDFVGSQLLRGAGQMLAFMPLNQASVGAVAEEDAADAAGLFNVARNLGGSLGLALLGVFIDRQTTVHAQSIGASITANSPLAQDRLATAAAGLASQTGDPNLARLQALRALSASVQQQALVMTFSEAFLMLGVAMACMLPLVFALRGAVRRGRLAEAGH